MQWSSCKVWRSEPWRWEEVGGSQDLLWRKNHRAWRWLGRAPGTTLNSSVRQQDPAYLGAPTRSSSSSCLAPSCPQAHQTRPSPREERKGQATQMLATWGSSSLPPSLPGSGHLPAGEVEAHRGDRSHPGCGRAGLEPHFFTAIPAPCCLFLFIHFLA